ncbi:MAG: helix-turn-helix domain-containing protein [Rhodospirillaceae bacterium]|nr:helix-turn-helix domain-containing protein [Rhodospirillaceae bacterium]
MAPPDRNISQTFSRGLAVLSQLNERNGSTAGQIAKPLGLNEVIVRRLLDTLTQDGYVQKNQRSGQYWLQAHTNVLASGYREDRWIAEVAQPAMDRLGRSVVWPVSLVTPSGLYLVVRTNTDERSPLTMRKTPIGHRYPLLNSASGPAYLSLCDADERDSLVNLLWTTDQKSLKGKYESQAALMTYLTGIRRRGYCIFDGPERVSAIAVPVARDGRAYAALTLRYFTSALSSREAAQRFHPLLAACAAHIGKVAPGDAL